MSTTPNRRGSRRVPPRGTVRVTCRKGALDLGPNLGLGLLDVSETGIRIVLKEALPVGQEVAVTLESAASGRRLLRLGNVVWCLAAEDGSCVTGLHFQKPLRYTDMDHVAKT